MSTSKTARTAAEEPKTLLSVPTSSNNPADVSETAPVAEFDAAAHHRETAQVAYRIWLERADGPGSPEGDWLKALSEVRAKYTR
jgi:hypothetical protein